jgi:hypothetical protein
VENFIQRLQDNDWKVLPEGKKIKYGTQAYGKKSIADYLSIGIAVYHHEQNYISALTCDNYISDAFNHGVIAEVDTITNKKQETQRKNLST